MKLVVTLVAFIPSFLIAQEKGVHFENNLSWKEIQAKAKKENKFIFMDCYATWCGPCKMMEKDVYPNDSVGDYINANFISFKVQMDTSEKDNLQTKLRYADAQTINTLYHINAYPSYLFFSPNGKVVHKGKGYKPVAYFIALSKDALDSKRQYFTLLENYEQGNKDFSALPYLAETSNSLGDLNLCLNIGRDYIENYLLHLKDSNLYTKENISFIKRFTLNSNDKCFKMFYLYADKVNNIMLDSMYSQSLIDYIISKEEIDPEVLTVMKVNGASPNWDNIKLKINEKYNMDYADRTVTSAKIRWYEWKKEWSNYTKNSSLFLGKYGAGMNDIEINEHAWGIFSHSTDKHELETALFWMNKIVMELPVNELQIDTETDTYANLLYKIGFKDEAIKWEKKAIELAIKEGFGERKEFLDGLNKMRAGLPTW